MRRWQPIQIDRGHQLELFPRPRTRRLGVVTCCAQKGSAAAPARELYRGRVFRMAARYMEAKVRAGLLERWVILSAEHGVVAPDQVLSPYDTALGDMAPEERAAWRARVRLELEALGARGRVLEFVGGREYERALDAFACENHIRTIATRGPARRRYGIGQLFSVLKAETLRLEGAEHSSFQ